jgi:hypothetical protein
MVSEPIGLAAGRGKREIAGGAESGGSSSGSAAPSEKNGARYRSFGHGDSVLAYSYSYV